MQVILLIGIPATGKSTFYKERFADTHLRINRDMVRTRHRERRLFEACLEIGQSVVVDNTNISKEVRARFIRPAIDAGATVTGYYFRSVASESLDRNTTRSGAARVPDKAVLSMVKLLQLPSMAEGFQSLFHVRISDRIRFRVEAWNQSTT